MNVAYIKMETSKRVALFLFFVLTIIECDGYDRPIIGVLTQEYHGGIMPNSSYLAASYVKYLESAGARVVPILINQNDEYYSNLFNWTNGVFFPGGNNYFSNKTSGYGKAGKIFYDRAVKANMDGDFYPVWGSCLGFELLCYLAAGSRDIFFSCYAEDDALPLKVVEREANRSTLFGTMPVDVRTYLETLPVTINYHRKCIDPAQFTKYGLDKFFSMLSFNFDRDTHRYISTVEAFDFPFYGTQWHPEKNQFEFVLMEGNMNVPHSYEAIRVGQHMANFFVNQARKSNHRFPDVNTENEHLIYKYSPIFSGNRKSKFEQEYFFPM